MNSSNYRFTLDLHSAQSQISIPALLGDTSRTFHISFSDGGKPYAIADGCLAKITIKRPTGKFLEEFCAIENNSTAIYHFDQNENTCAVEGIHDCDITLYGLDGKRIASPRFSMVVSETVIRRDDIDLTDDDFTAVDAMVKAEVLRQSAEADRVSAEAERASAESDRIAAEDIRISAENERIAAESQRISAENDRASAEAERIASESERTSAELERVSRDTAREENVDLAVRTSNNAVETAESAVDTATDARDTAYRAELYVNNEIAAFKATLGSEALTTGKQTIKGSVNYAVATADSAKQQSDIVRANLINITAQVEGIGRTYVIPTFLSFIDFLKSKASVKLSEDRNGDGFDETYDIYVSDLKTGDNIIITEDGVPDFWFEKNSALTTFNKYTYNKTEYTLSAVANGNTIGGAYILETDYTVIEGYSLSASASASDAADSASRALQSEGNAARSETNAAQSEAAAKASEINAKASETEIKSYGANLYARASRNSKHIANIEKVTSHDPSVAYTKAVPKNAQPYAEIAEVGGMTYRDGSVLQTAKVTAVESVGRNIFGGEALANKIKEVNPIAIVDAEQKTVLYSVADIASKILFTDFKPNTQYTFIFKGLGSANFVNITIKYTDGTRVDSWRFDGAGKLSTFRFVSDASKSIELLQGVYYDGSTTLYYDECGVFEGNVSAADFTPYIHATLPIPTEVQALVGYGEGNPNNMSEYNAIYWDENGKQYYSHKGDIVNGVWVPLTTPEVIDISDILLADNLIKVEGNGSLTFKNEYGYAVPSEVTYALKDDTVARIGTVSLPASGWVGEGYLFSQVVNINGVTENSQVDLTPSVEQLAIFYEKDLAFVTENEDGVVTVYAIGQKPLNDYTIQVTITEVDI